MATLSASQSRVAGVRVVLLAGFLLALACGPAAGQHGAPAAEAAQPAHASPAHHPVAGSPAEAAGAHGDHTQAGAGGHAEPVDAHAAETHGEGAHAADAHETDAHEADAHEAEHHDEPLWKTGARLFNFAVLAGTLVYFLRAPMREYFDGRIQSVRSDLVTAAELRLAATAQLAAVDERLRALPGELQSLRAKGAADIDAERARIRVAAEAERDRLTAQARAQAAMRVRAASRELTSAAVERIVAAAEGRIRSSIGETDHTRLIERYLEQVPAAGRTVSADGGVA